MPPERKLKFQEGLVVVAFLVAMEFQMSAVCTSQGFSFRRDTSEVQGDSTSYYHSFSNYGKFNERTHQFSRNGDLLTREIRIKQGRLKGFIKEFKSNKLNNVEAFLGVPYAAPPVKSLRFMPPGSPPTWTNLRVFDSFASACPQTPPDPSHKPLGSINLGYFNRLKALLPFLANQSEDCLYLNIYAPLPDANKFPKKHPVIVYVHGESFEWNSGNPYDGSILASYGNVVVVTINFRLGILGFLRPGLSEHTVSNFGLLDQIAALQWIKDNIEEFGGDPSSVTLMGHGTGAACINFLMVSPVSMASQGLFHKAILMSGTALADWALTHNPLQFTIQVAEALNCPLVDKNDELSNCLRRKRLSEIMSVKVTVPEFQTPFGPIVDGSVVPNTPRQVMGVYQNLFTRYELLYGITEWEAYHMLDPVSLTYGMLEVERDELLRKYMYSRYEALPFFALATTLSEYLDWRKSIPPARSAAEEHRDFVLDLLSDARFTAPVIQMALYHSKINPKSYLYVFKHKSKMGDFAESERSVSGEEIPYVFGAPLLNEEGPLAHHKFSPSEQLLSESILTYFTNFAKTGNPNAPLRLEYLTLGPNEWRKFDVYWPEYDSANQSFVALDTPPRIDHHYRSQMTRYWNDILPELMNNPTKVKTQKPENPMELPDSSHAKPPISSNPSYKKKSDNSNPWTYGTVRMSPKEYAKEKKPFLGEEEVPSWKQMDRPSDQVGVRTTNENDTNSSSVPYLVAVTVSLLLLNVLVIGYYCYKKRKLNIRDEERNRTAITSNVDNSHDKADKKSSQSEKENLYSVAECSEGSNRNQKSSKIRRCLSNTAAGSEKVKKWIQSEVLDKYSRTKKTSRNLLNEEEHSKVRRSFDNVSEGSSKAITLPKPILKKPTRMYHSNEDLKGLPHKRNVRKVSVGVDATPSTMGASVLQQTPIEITKSLDRGLLKLCPPEKETEESFEPSRKSRTSISLQILPTNGDVKFVTSDKLKATVLDSKGDPKTDFRTFSVKNSKDINVTSRDSEVISILENSHVDPLENIQKRNFPKVLPDFPDTKAAMRTSFPQSSLVNGPQSNRCKSQFPPPPPPRISTLSRTGSPKREEKDQPKFSTFAPLVTSQKDADDLAKKDDDSSSSTLDEKSDSSKKSVIAKPIAAARREQPSIVIQPKIGPRKQGKQKGPPGKAHIHLQANEARREKNSRSEIVKSKGASDAEEKTKRAV